MPQKIKMFLSNGNATFAQIRAFHAANAPAPAPVPAPNKKPASLNDSMIHRIHNVKPGCNSCGKK